MIKRYYFLMLVLFGTSIFVGCSFLDNAKRPTKAQKQAIVNKRIAEAKADGKVTAEEKKRIQEAKQMETDEVQEYLEIGQQVARYVPGWGTLVSAFLGLVGTGWQGYRSYRRGRVNNALSKAVDSIGKTIEEDKDGKLTKEDAKALVKNVADQFGVREDMDILYKGLKQRGIIDG